VTFLVSFFGHSPDLLERRAITIPGVFKAAMNCSQADHGHLAEKNFKKAARGEPPGAVIALS
jgi:hypothetical protein